MLGRDQAGQVGGCTALSHYFLPALRCCSESSVSPWAGFGHSKSWLAACLKGTHAHSCQVLQFAALAVCL